VASTRIVAYFQPGAADLLSFLVVVVGGGGGKIDLTVRLRGSVARRPRFSARSVSS